MLQQNYMPGRMPQDVSGYRNIFNNIVKFQSVSPHGDIHMIYVPKGLESDEARLNDYSNTNLMFYHATRLTQVDKRRGIKKQALFGTSRKYSKEIYVTRPTENARKTNIWDLYIRTMTPLYNKVTELMKQYLPYLHNSIEKLIPKHNRIFGCYTNFVINVLEKNESIESSNNIDDNNSRHELDDDDVMITNMDKEITVNSDENDKSDTTHQVTIKRHIDPDYDMSAVLILGCFEGAPFIVKTLGLNIYAQPGDIIFFKASELDHAVGELTRGKRITVILFTSLVNTYSQEQMDNFQK